MVRLSTDEKAPWRTGRLVVVSEDFVRRAFCPDQMVDRLLRQRVAFIPIEAFERLGLDQAVVD